MTTVTITEQTGNTVSVSDAVTSVVEISGLLVQGGSGGGGGVNLVTGTAPITASPTSGNVTVSISQATSTTNGYLSSTDWNTFNNKLGSVGGLSASDISDFDTEVSNNSDVASNTSSRHDAATILDSATINFAITGQQITGSVIPSGIDHDSLLNFTSSEHFVESSINHTNIQNIGSNTHAQIDTHLATSSIHFPQTSISIVASQVSDFDTEVSNNSVVSTNSAHVTSTTNPHSVSAAQVGNSIAQWNANQLVGVSMDNTVGSPSDGDILVYRSAGNDFVLEAKPASGSNPAINDITDVSITSVADNEVLAYDTTSGDWINQTAAEAGLATTSHTQAASTITDFDTEVSNNVSVAANTAFTTAPSTVITAGTNLSWSGNTLNATAIGGGSNINQQRWTANGMFQVGTTVDGAWLSDSSWNITGVRMWRGTAGASGSTIIDINKNGTTMYSTQGNRPTILYNDADNKIDGTLPDDTTISAGDVITLDIDSIESGNPQDLVIIIEGE